MALSLFLRWKDFYLFLVRCCLRLEEPSLKMLWYYRPTAACYHSLDSVLWRVSLKKFWHALIQASFVFSCYLEVILLEGDVAECVP